jgi:catechol 2,3-dioxygenase-like lactoylglutathione lyase family enzyme
MSPIRHFDHVGITVRDLDTVTAFFVGLGFETEGRTVLEGEFLDTVIGIPDARTEIVMLRPPDGGTGLELSSFIRPDHEPGSPRPHAERTGVAQRDVRGGRPSGDPRPARRGRLPPGRRRRSVRGHLEHGVCARTRGFHRELGPANQLIRARNGVCNDSSPTSVSRHECVLQP